METIIARDTDVLREYLAALDARERGLSPFAKLAATIKLARLRRELATAELEATDEDFTALRREMDERLNRSLLRRFLARPWGARLSVFLTLVLGQQLALAVIWLLTILFVRFSPVPKQWNPVLPHEQPPFLFAFILFFFFATPMLALLVAFGGRYFRAWRITLPATFAIFALSALAIFLVARDKEKNNPVRHISSIGQFMKERAKKEPQVNAANYEDWVNANWLMKDAKFKRDYESYLRNGPGRWITSRFNSPDDAAWSSSLAIMDEYLDGGQDANGFRDWLKYYLDRNRIYSEDRIDEEAAALTGRANQRYLGIWQLEPYLNERDQRLYRAYLGSIDWSMKRWGLAWLGLLALAFLSAYAARPTFSVWKRLIGRRDRPDPVEAPGWDHHSAFPERNEITTPPFYETPIKLLSRVHRGFLRLAVSTTLVVFAFWAVIYAFELSGDRPNPTSQVALMRGNLLFGGSANRAPAEAASEPNRLSAITLPETERTPPSSGDEILSARVRELEQALDENDYQSDKKFKAQYRVIAAQRSELYALKSATGQLQGLPEQLTTIGSRVGAAEARAGEGVGQAEAARQTAEGVQKQLGSKLTEVETRATRAAEQVGKVEDQASVLATRTEALEKELDRRARQIEARTEELGERTAGLKEREERIDRLQRIAFAAIFGELKSSVDDLDRRVTSSFYRFLSKGEARRDVDSLRQRITSLTNELRAMNTDQAKQFIGQLDELGKRVDQISERIK
ncbi:MAG TPA: hypothetical protein VKF81_02445 [Blastocatellia bacterium]|nr:hypothetical protein [Blastocatellia bacterium]